jgi:hypothetical protein
MWGRLFGDFVKIQPLACVAHRSIIVLVLVVVLDFLGPGKPSDLYYNNWESCFSAMVLGAGTVEERELKVA